MSDDAKKPSCFVIQQFDDGGMFDKRYQETIRPALIQAGVEPIRADAILGLKPVINKIETAIKDASICLAEISVDNPNVWLELGYALALDRPTVILCDRALRGKLPFDISHRPVILYRTDSKSGYEELEKGIVKYIKNELEKATTVDANPFLTSQPKDFDDLKGYEIVILARLLAGWATSPEGVAHWELEKRLETMGYSEMKMGMGIANLLKKNLITQDIDGQMDSSWFVYRLTPEGVAWLQANEDMIEFTEPPKPKPQPQPQPGPSGFPDDDIPF